MALLVCTFFGSKLLTFNKFNLVIDDVPNLERPKTATAEEMIHKKHYIDIFRGLRRLKIHLVVILHL